MIVITHEGLFYSVVQVIAIGPTTATSLKQVGIFPIMAHAPTPEALLVAVHQCFL
jgi:uroporphyrinogen-III synthase